MNMARYDYKCPSCGKQFEVEHPMSEHPTILCPDCGQEAQRVFSASGIHFEGHGFYNTDQRKSVGSVGSKE
jgi:putative FmdB family regulatory protein